MVQLGVYGSDVETMVGRVKLKDTFENPWTTVRTQPR